MCLEKILCAAVVVSTAVTSILGLGSSRADR